MIFYQQADIAPLRLKAEKIRKRIIEIIYRADSGHTGGSLSATDILTALYFGVMNVNPSNPKMSYRDRFILSKGHSVESLYCVLAEAGFISDRELETYGKFGSILAGHPTINVPGVEINSGALGHGLSVGVGMALAARMDKLTYRVFVLMGDGEQAEGSVYEAAISAGHYRLGNMVAIIDRNLLQISGYTEDVMSLEPLGKRWKSFGWEVHYANGNHMDDLVNCFRNIPDHSDKPQLIIADTVKGKGVSFMENVAKWHHGVPDRQQFRQAISEINSRIYQLSTLQP